MRIIRQLSLKIIKINWWLWMCLTIPFMIYSWVMPRDLEGWTTSDWDYLTDYLRHTDYRFTEDLWSFFVLSSVLNTMPPLVVGWIAQYLITLAWQAWRRRGRTDTVTNRETA